MMKTRIIALFAGLLAVLPMTSAWAHSGTHNCSIKAAVGSGNGKVYCSFAKEKDTTSVTDQFNCSGGNNSETKTGYFYAIPDDGWGFDGWYSDEGGKSRKSTTASANSTFTCTDGEVTWYAFFSKQCQIRFGAAEHGSYTVSGGGTIALTKNANTLTASKELTMTAQPDEGYAVKTWWYRESGGERVELGNGLTYKRVFEADAEVGVEFVARKLVELRFDSAENGSITVDGSVKSAKSGYDKVSATLKATPSDGYGLVGWYTKDSNGNKTYFAYSSEVSVEYEDNVTIGADFVSGVSLIRVGVGEAGYVENDDLAGTISEAADADVGKTIVVYADQSVTENLTIPYGVTIIVRAGATVRISESTTLTAEGRLAIEGAVQGGTLSHSYKTIVQYGPVVVPYPAGTDGVETGKGYESNGTAGKYVVAKTEDGSVSGTYSCADLWFATIVTADGKALHTVPAAETPTAVVCDVNRKTALNYIVGLADVNDKKAYTDIEKALTVKPFEGDFSDNDKIVVLVKSVSDVFATSYKSATAPAGFAVECAGNSISFKPKQWHGAQLVKFFNGASVGFNSTNDGGKIMSTRVLVYNCQGGTISRLSGSYVGGASLYDSPNVKVTIGEPVTSNTKDGGGVKVYSGGPYVQIPYPTAKKTFTQVFGGYFASNMNPDGYLYNPKTMESKKNADGYWVVTKKVYVSDYPAKIGDQPYDSLSAAIQSAAAGDVIKLQSDIKICGKLIVAKDRTVIVDIDGWTVISDSEDAMIENHGNLELIDDNGSALVGEIDVPIVNDGTLLLSKATYGRDISLNGGKCHFLQGAFNGRILVHGALVPAEVAEVDGGTFAGSTCLHGDESVPLVDLCENGYMQAEAGHYVLANVPCAYVTGKGSYVVRAYDAEDAAIYEKIQKSTARTGYASQAEWIRSRKMYATNIMFGGWFIDCTLTCDRPVAKDTISAGIGNLDVDLSANEPYSAFLQTFRKMTNGKAPYVYRSFLPGGENAEKFDVVMSDVDCANAGTTCLIEMRLTPSVRWQRSPRDYSYEFSSSKVIDSERLVFDAGSNVAMIRPETGAVMFYPTLKAACEATKNGETVMLCNDCATCEPISTPCSFKFDVNGFEFTGVIRPAEGFRKSVVDGAYEIAEKEVTVIDVPAAEGEDGVKVEVANEIVHKAEEEAKAALPAGATDEQIEAKKQEIVQQELQRTDVDTGLKVWQVSVLEGAGVVVKGEQDENTAAVVETKPVENAKSENDVAIKVDVDVVSADVKSAVSGVGFAKVVSAEGLTLIDKSVVRAEENAKDTVAVNLAEQPNGVYQPTLLVSDAAGKTVEIPDPKAAPYVVMHTEAAKGKEVVIAVPGVSFVDGKDVKIDKVIDSSTLCSGDRVRMFKDGQFETWTYRGDGWEQGYVSDEGGNRHSPAASTIRVPAGSAFWFTRSAEAKAEQVTVVARRPKDLTTEVAAPKAGKDKEWNMIANPNPEGEFDLNAEDAVVGADTKDVIVMPSDDANAPQRTYTRDAEGKWGYDAPTVKEVKIGKKTMKVIVNERKGEAKLGVGQGVWYITGGKTAPKIDWTKVEK